MTDQKSSLRILDAGSGEGKSIKLLELEKNFDVELTRSDINEDSNPDIVWDITQPPPEELVENFDIVVCNHVLEHLARNEVIGAVKNLRDCLVDQGELRLATPSLEWCASQVLAQDQNPVVLPVLFGSQENEHQIHRSGFTLAWLREIIVVNGLIPRRMNQGTFHLIMDGDEYLAVENVAIAVRFKEFENVASDPAAALD